MILNTYTLSGAVQELVTESLEESTLETLQNMYDTSASMGVAALDLTPGSTRELALQIAALACIGGSVLVSLKQQETK
jgi:hypothetical protein